MSVTSFELAGMRSRLAVYSQLVPWFVPPHEHSQLGPMALRHFAPHLCSEIKP